MAYLLIVSTLLFLPGLLMTYLLNLNRYRFLLSFSLSYVLFVLLFKSTAYIGQSVSTFKYIYFLIIFLLTLLACLRFFRTRKNAGAPYVAKFYACNGYLKWVPVIIIIFVAAYFLLVGAYVELPADVFQHLEYMQQTTRHILLSESTDTPITAYLGQNGKYWHYLYSLLAMWSGVSLQEAILPASFFNVSVFLLGIFWFSRVVFKDLQLSPKMLVFSSAAAVFFTFFHYGINIFSICSLLCTRSSYS